MSKVSVSSSLEDRIRGGLWGVLVADALGVPHEFKHHTSIPGWNRTAGSVEMVMPKEYRKTFPKVPYGSWSDDGALTLALASSLARMHSDWPRFNAEDFGRRMVAWLTAGDYTPDGKTFDVGNTTQEALLRIVRGHSVKASGLTAENSNGNGSLMRTLPLALWHQGSDAELYADACEQSSVTHAHDLSKASCGVYCVAARYVLNGETVAKGFVEGLRLAHVKLDIPNRPGGSGFVLDTLAAAIHIARTGCNYEMAVLNAIALGGDTDTTAAVVGGLVGVRDGLSGIPSKWLEPMRGQDLAGSIIENFVQRRFDPLVESPA